MPTYVWVVHDPLYNSQYTWGVHSSFEKAVWAAKTIYSYRASGTWELQKESESNFILIKELDGRGQLKRWITRWEVDENEAP